MYADVEQLVLSGRLFEGNSRSSSPERSPSPDRKGRNDWPDDAIENNDSDDGQDDYDSDAARRARDLAPTIQQPREPIGMRPGRTGVKGVIRDRAEAQQRERVRRAKEIEELNQTMEKASLGGKTFLEEEREREWMKAALEGQAGPGSAESRADGKGRFGHLREVGVSGFVDAVEREKGVWVVVHIYDPSLDRCASLDSNLTRLARLNPDVKFLRTRAGALGFASTSSRPHSHTSGRSNLLAQRAPRPSRVFEDDEEDPYAYEERDITESTPVEDYDDDDDDDDDVDTDVLPTLLVYRDGQLVHNWVRVDWEAGEVGVDELLRRHHVLHDTGPGFGNCGLPSDDEDLFGSDIDA